MIHARIPGHREDALLATIDPEITHRALEAVRYMDRIRPVRAAYLFGSQVNGQADEWSDIDVALFVEGIEQWDLFQCARAMADIQRHAGLDVEAHLFPASAYENPELGSFSQYILKHGVLLDVSGLSA